MKCMGVDDKAFDRSVFNIGLEETRFDSLLYQRLLTRCCTFCERAIVLHIVKKSYILHVLFRAHHGNRDIGDMRTAEGITA